MSCDEIFNDDIHCENVLDVDYFFLWIRVNHWHNVVNKKLVIYCIKIKVRMIL